MKYALLIATSIVAVSVALPASAQSRRAAKAPTEVIVKNARAAAITAFSLTNAEGKSVGALKTALASGKTAKIKLAKGASCTLNVEASFEDESEATDGQVDVCADKTIRFTD